MAVEQAIIERDSGGFRGGTAGLTVTGAGEAMRLLVPSDQVLLPVLRRLARLVHQEKYTRNCRTTRVLSPLFRASLTSVVRARATS